MIKRFIPLLSAALTIASVAPSWAATDPYRVRQWGFDRIRAEQSWRVSKGAGVTIAILDTGIDLTHPDLKGKIAAAYTCAEGTCAPGGDDDNGHGSHVAGVAAATTGNGVGVAGVAPSAKLMAVKVLDADGDGACSDVELGIRWAADRGADVINLSLGPEIFDPLSLFCSLEDEASYAWGKGAVVIIAAGNEGLFSFYSTDHLLVVGATRPDDSPASYSNAGANIYAPGGQRGSSACSHTTCVFSTWKDGRYAAEQGTSMAVPHVSGVAALLLAKGYTNAQAFARILSTADDVDGFPRLNAARAVGVVAGTKTVKPKPPSGSGSGSRGSTRPGSTAPSNTDPRSTTAPASSVANNLTPMPVASPSLAGMNPQAFADTPPPTPASRRPILASVAGGLVLLVGAGLLGRRLRRS